MVEVDELVPLSGRSVPFAAPSAAAGLRAATASTKLERKISLRSDIPDTPFLGPRPSCLRANGSWSRVDRNEAEAEGSGGPGLRLVGRDGNRSSPPYASLCARGACPDRLHSRGARRVATPRRLRDTAGDVAGVPMT